MEEYISKVVEYPRSECTSKDFWKCLPSLVNQNERRALLVDHRLAVRYENVLKFLGYNVVFCKERFANFPHFWLFEMEKSPTIAASWERSKSVGFFIILRGNQGMQAFSFPFGKSRMRLEGSEWLQR